MARGQPPLVCMCPGRGEEHGVLTVCMCPGRREGKGMMGAWYIDCVCVSYM